MPVFFDSMPRSGKRIQPENVEVDDLFEPLNLRLGLGLLRLTTDGRPDEFDARAVIHFALNQGIRILDTADSYCLSEDDLHYGEHLVRNALNSWPGPQNEVRVVTKVGMSRPQGRWVPNGKPKHLRSAVDGSLNALDVDQLFLLQLHVRDPGVPFEDTLAALAELQAEGKVQHLGLCNVTVAEIQQAQRHFPVAAVQNELSVINRKFATDGTLTFTKREGIPFLAYRPLGGHAKTDRLAKSSVLQPLADRHTSTVHEVALAAVLDASPHVIPLVGATQMKSVRSSVAACAVQLDISDRMALSLEHSFEPLDVIEVPTASAPTVRADCSAKDPGPGNSAEVVLLMGIQGAGKSELVTSYLESGYARLNRDELGGTLDGLVPRLTQLLHNGQTRVILDNTYATRSSRAGVIAAATARGIPTRCVFLNTPLHEAWINVAQRMISRYGMPLGPTEMKFFGKADPNLPPPQALMRWVSSFESPHTDEGFSSVAEVPFVRRTDPTHEARGLLLDVDGTLRITKSGEVYPRHADDVEVLPGRTTVLQRWIEAGYQLFFVSNQSGIASGRVTHEAVQAAMFRTAELLQVPITEMVYCTHPFKPVGCFCRKPMPGLGVYLMQRHLLSREHAVMVGDRDSDSQFAANLGIRFVDSNEFFSSGSLPPG